MWRNFQLMKSMAKTDHPFSKFSTGNAETLKITPEKEGYNIRELLLDFYEKYYSANIMRVAVYGSDSLDTMQKWVEEKFSNVVNKNLSLNCFPSDPYGPRELGRVVEVVPVKDLKSLDIFFPMPSVQPLYESKPMTYVSHLIGHESEGSILAYLKQKGWANGLGSYVFLSQQDFSVFRVSIALSDDGTEHVDDIVGAFFSYIGMLIKEGPQEWIAEENKATQDMEFRFLQKTEPSSYCTQVAENMHLYPPEHVLSGPHLVFDTSIEKIPDKISLLKPSNCMICVSNKNFSGKTTLKERWYGTEYNCAAFSPNQMERWCNALSLHDECTDPSALFLPITNPFLPTDFDLCPIDENWKSTHENVCLVSGPVVITSIIDNPDVTVGRRKEISKGHESVSNTTDEGCLNEGVGLPDAQGRHLRTWFMQDSKWKVPKVNVYIELVTVEAYSTPGNVACTDLFANILTELLAEYSYYADCGGLSYDVRNSFRGLVIIFYGYHHKLGTLMAKTLEEMRKMGDMSCPSSPCSEELFTRVKEKLLRNLANTTFSQPYSHCMTGTLNCLEHPRWSYVEKYAALSSLTWLDFKSFSSLLIKRMFAEVFVIGNITPFGARDLSMSVVTALGCKKLPECLVPVRRSVNLQEGKEYIYRQFARDNNPSEVNSAIENLYFVGPECGRSSGDVAVETVGDLTPIEHARDISEWSELALESTLAFVAHLINEPAFDQLRTKEQLGYIVHTSKATIGNRICLRVIVQSNSQDPIYLNGRVESFLRQFFDEILSALSETYLIDNKKSCIENLLEKPKNLDKESAGYFSEISSGCYFFTRKQKMAKFIGTISKDDLMNFYSAFMLPESNRRCKFSSQFFGCEQDTPPTLTEDNKIFLVRNPTKFKNAMPLRPLSSSDEDVDNSYCLH